MLQERLQSSRPLSWVIWLCGLAYGFLAGKFGGIIEAMKTLFNLEPTQIGQFNTAFFIGAAVGGLILFGLALIPGRPVNRKMLLLISVILFAVTSIGSLFTLHDFTLLTIIRAIEGLETTMWVGVAPVIVSEVLGEEAGGPVIAPIQFGITIGVFVGLSVPSLFGTVPLALLFMAAIGVILAIGQFVATLKVPGGVSGEEQIPVSWDALLGQKRRIGRGVAIYAAQQVVLINGILGAPELVMRGVANVHIWIAGFGLAAILGAWIGSTLWHRLPIKGLWVLFYAAMALLVVILMTIWFGYTQGLGVLVGLSIVTFVIIYNIGPGTGVTPLAQVISTDDTRLLIAGLGNLVATGIAAVCAYTFPVGLTLSPLFLFGGWAALTLVVVVLIFVLKEEKEEEVEG